MNTCGTCKHWQPCEEPEPDEYNRSDPFVFNRLGTCGAILSTDEYRGGFDDAGALPAKPTVAVAADASDLGTFRTAAAFGCVLWEARP